MHLGKLAFLLVIVAGGMTMCSVNNLMLNSDPNVAPAFEQAQQDAKPVLAALDQYQAAHGFYPRSLREVRLPDDARRGFLYVVSSMNRVYQSLECAGRIKEFQGPHRVDAQFKQQQADFLDECVRGYSQFALKSGRIQTAWKVNASVTAYAEFTSQAAQWKVARCSQQPQGTFTPDCRRTTFDDDAPERSGHLPTPREKPRPVLKE